MAFLHSWTSAHVLKVCLQNLNFKFYEPARAQYSSIVLVRVAWHVTLPKIREKFWNHSMFRYCMICIWPLVIRSAECIKRHRLAAIYTYSSQFLSAGMPNCPSGKLSLTTTFICLPIARFTVGRMLNVVVPTVQIRTAGPVSNNWTKVTHPLKKPFCSRLATNRCERSTLIASPV